MYGAGVGSGFLSDHVVYVLNGGHHDLFVGQAVSGEWVHSGFLEWAMGACLHVVVALLAVPHAQQSWVVGDRTRG